jgi:hypothetical protein
VPTWDHGVLLCGAREGHVQRHAVALMRFPLCCC